MKLASIRFAWLLVGCLWAGMAGAQVFPNKTIKLIVGYPAGGAVDLVARTLARQLSTSLHQQVVIDNKPGAGTNIAVKSLIAAEPDGYTLMLAANALAANMALYHPPPYDAERDLVSIAMVGRVPVVIAAHPAVQISNVRQLIEEARSKPGSMAYASPGNGSTPHLAIELFARAAGIELRHIPYRGGAAAITDVIGGQLPLVAVNALEVLPHVKSGKLKLLAQLSDSRGAIFPETATIAESGFPGFEASVWYGLVAPAGTPKPVIDQLHAAVEQALESGEMRERMISVGGDVVLGDSLVLTRLIRSEHVRYAKLIREAQIKPD